jgi:hypothetical protein
MHAQQKTTTHTSNTQVQPVLIAFALPIDAALRPCCHTRPALSLRSSFHSLFLPARGTFVPTPSCSKPVHPLASSVFAQTNCFKHSEASEFDAKYWPSSARAMHAYAMPAACVLEVVARGRTRVDRDEKLKSNQMAGV